MDTNEQNDPEQECIPVGCVRAARWPYAAVCFRGGGAWSRGGGWCVPGPGGGVCLVPGGGGVCSGGVCLVPGGVCLVPERGGAWSGGVSQHALRQTPSPPVDRILDTRLWKYYLGPTSLRPVNIPTQRTFQLTKGSFTPSESEGELFSFVLCRCSIWTHLEATSLSLSLQLKEWTVHLYM